MARSRPEQRAALDLRSWRYAHLGGETVRAGTLAGFAKAFAPAGLHPAALQPGYGLAEATLLVTAGRRGERFQAEPVSRRALASEGGVAPPESERRRRAHRRLRQPGRRHRGTDRRSRLWSGRDARAPSGIRYGGRVGEIWVRGPGVVRGYWRNRRRQRSRASVRTAFCAPATSASWPKARFSSPAGSRT